MKTLSKILLAACLTLPWACADEDPGPTDSTKPVVASISPSNGETNVSIATKITITFSENLNASTVTSGSLTLKEGTTNVPGAISVSGTVVTFTPSANLKHGTLYTVTLSGSITDEAGNTLSGSASTSFTTVEDGVDTIAPSVLTIDPESGEEGVDPGANIVVTFSESMDLSSVSNSTVALTTPALVNNVQAEVSISGSVMTINPTSALEEGAEYTLTLGTGLSDLAGNGLAVAFVSSFTTSGNPTPTVVSTNPSEGATNVPVGQTFEITFSEEMNESEMTFRFDYSGGNTSNVSVSKAGNKLLVTPTNALLQNTDHTLTISGKSLAGVPLASSYVLHFKTAVVNLEVTSVTPDNNANNVAITSVITIQFSHNVKSSTVNTSTIQLLKNGTEAVPGAFSVTNDQVIFTPTNPMTEFQTDYEIVIGTGVQATHGGNVASAVQYNFTTEIASDAYYYNVKRLTADLVMIAKLDPEGVVFNGISADTPQQKWYFQRTGNFFRIWNKNFSTKSLDYTSGTTSRVGITASPRYWQLDRISEGVAAYHFSIPGIPTLYWNLETFETQVESVSGDTHAWVLIRAEAR